MTDHDFRALVKLLRQKQKEYFRTRDQAILNQCRDLERRVDEALLPPKPAGLFDQQGGA